MVRLLVCVNKQSIKQLLDLAFAVGSLTLTQPCLFHRSPKPPSIIVLIYQGFFYSSPPPTPPSSPVLMYFYRHAQLRSETRTGRIKIGISVFPLFCFVFGWSRIV